ncbi:guanine nucleotide exchange factor lte1 [Ophiostoma piceae UAMH 11346]|uniref:Guanine nucleotide exchange factor lte1 n=1 Tax=Ophiostoma piceae (strain UAMH 11346) TaxID=1262450 RepID=S3D2P6_OPHP1|nr:guanine nucleotide exchange factor lte1 [Ophiostoma piceae UAMH 11346]
MDTAFELPTYSPAGVRIPVDQPAAISQPPQLPPPRIAPSRTSLSPKRILQVSSSPGTRARLGVASQLGKTADSSVTAGETTQRPATTASPAATQALAQATAAAAAATNSGGSLRELKLRRGLTPRAETERQTGVRGIVGRPKTRNAPQPAQKPLLPLTERKSQEENKLDRLAKKDKDVSDSDKGDIAPDGSSGGREGRQFTVSNVGNNGRIYLRPTVRPAHLRFPQPNFVFPITPPATAGLDLLAQDKERRGDMQRRPSQPQEPNAQWPLQQEQKNRQQQSDQTQTPQQLPPPPPPPAPIIESHLIYGSDWMSDLTPSPTAIPLLRPRFAAKNTSRSGNSIRPTTAGAVGGRAAGGHRRAVSDSTIQDTSIARESDPGGFKIVISQPKEDALRSRTLEDLDQLKSGLKAPHLEISIPSWKIGTPRFTMRGTPILHGSSYAPTEEPRSSRPSYFSLAFANSRSLRDGDALISPRQGLFEQQRRSQMGIPSPLVSPGFHLDDPERGMRLTYHSNYAVVEPSMFDTLTFKPSSDDRSIVRFSSTNNAITAATPPRLVAEITSPKFMDYDLVSDFFLTYRAFLEPLDLLRMLVARLRWAVARDDETGMVVRVRTFVALRHWILNYFMDDFVVDYALRILFCTLLNSFVDELSNNPKGRKVQLKILTELKKCWRRSCAQYWDGEDFDDALGPEVPISPGGIAGHRNPALDPTFWEQVISGELPDDDDDDNGSTFLTHLHSPESMVHPEPGSSFSATGDRSGRIDSIVMGERPATPETQARPSEVSERRQASPVSISSMDFVSCSFPTKNMRMLQASMGQPLGAHPAEPSLTYSSSGPVAMTPRALVGKRVRPSDSQKSTTTQSHQHKRNNSLSDSLREHASATERMLQKNTEILMSLPYAGSLVRGNIFPPGQPYVEILPPGTSSSARRQTTLFQTFPAEIADSQKEKASAMSSQGMRKLLGSVRRAISTRGQIISPSLGSFINISPPGPRDATTNRLPGTAIVPQARPRMNGFRPPVRIDLLGAKIAEDFKIAVREDEFEDDPENTKEETIAMPTPTLPDLGLNLPQYRNLTAASNYSDSIFFGWIPGRGDSFMQSPMSDAGITTGSKSIVIVDGTLPSDFPAMSGALPEHNPSVEMFGDTFLSVAADPTPPTTPPGLPTGTPRRSSYLLGRPPFQPSLSMDPLPPFIPDLDTLRADSVVGPPHAPVADDSMIPSSDIMSDEPDSRAFPRRASGGGISVAESIAGTSTTEKNHGINSFGMPSSPPVRMPRPSWAYGHARHPSSRSHRSNRSYGLRRAASFSSGIMPRSDARSFDASTYDSGMMDESKEDEAPQPLRVLRRRPGGDLRAATNIGDLDYVPIRRSHSVGSLTTYSESVRSSFKPSRARGSNGFVDVISVDYTQEEDKAKDEAGTFSIGMITDKKPARQVSLFSAHTSKPIMRPSFEAEAQKLAQIPDDDDDGGVESALLKLEGKYERKSKQLSFSDPLHTIGSPTAAKKGGLPVLSGFSPHKTSRDNRTTAEERFKHRHRQIVNSNRAPSSQSVLSKLAQFSTAADTLDDADESQFGTDDARDSSLAPSSRAPAFSPPPTIRPAAVPRMLEDVQSFVTQGSGESYCSIPLLDRGLTDDGRSRGALTDEWGDQSVIDGTNESGQQTPTALTVLGAGQDGSHPNSYQMVKKTVSIEKIHPGETMPRSPTQATEVSVFEDDDESDHASDLSSEMSAEDEEDRDLYNQAARNPGDPNAIASRLPVHPLGDPQRDPPAQSQYIPVPELHPGKLVEDTLMGSHPPSPPMTLVQALLMSPDTGKIPELHESQLWEDKPLPPTPGDADGGGKTKKQLQQEAEMLSAIGMQPMLEQKQKAQPRTAAGLEAARKFSVHLPFILAFESEILAQQFTLIEKDALHEIDWRELIEMRWKNAENGNARSWVDFLRNTDARGVEVVIARFNIMVKWTISEVILTQDIEERARCLIKFIHIASHCRRYRNYATMSQITIALSSNEISRLTQTWAMVPPSDISTLRDLESLVMPTRNFYSLRAEMEAVDIDNAESGCIPFVGIYTHDLLFNAQRPSEIASSPTTAPLVNFERCRVAASIVKTLLRLVEASALYNFQPIEGVTERCLWMSALSDDEIRKFSELLE